MEVHWNGIDHSSDYLHSSALFCSTCLVEYAAADRLLQLIHSIPFHSFIHFILPIDLRGRDENRFGSGCIRTMEGCRMRRIR